MSATEHRTQITGATKHVWFMCAKGKQQRSWVSIIVGATHFDHKWNNTFIFAKVHRTSLQQYIPTSNDLCNSTSIKKQSSENKEAQKSKRFYESAPRGGRTFFPPKTKFLLSPILAQAARGLQNKIYVDIFARIWFFREFQVHDQNLNSEFDHPWALKEF